MLSGFGLVLIPVTGAQEPLVPGIQTRAPACKVAGWCTGDLGTPAPLAPGLDAQRHICLFQGGTRQSSELGRKISVPCKTELECVGPWYLGKKMLSTT